MLPVSPPCLALLTSINDETGECTVEDVQIYELTTTDILFQIKIMDGGIAKLDTIIITKEEYLTALGIL